MFCINCGKKNTTASNYCYSCGFNIEKISQKDIDNSLTTVETDSQEIDNKNFGSMWHCEYCDKAFETKTVAVKHEKVCEFRSKNRILSNKRIVPKETEYASFLNRLGAWVIDYFGVLVTSYFYLTVLAYLLEVEPDGTIINVLWYYLCYVTYNTLMLSIFSTTIGKSAFGLKVVTTSNESLKFGCAFKRSLLQPIATSLFGYGYWEMHKNDKKQARHDIITNTVVIRKKKNLIIAYILLGIVSLIYLASLSSK